MKPPDDPLTARDVTVIVPVGGAADAWPRCARSLERLDPPPGKIVVVLDGARAEHEGPAEAIGAEIVALERRGGPARARNAGARAAESELLFFLDSDVEVPPDLCGRVAREFASRPEVTAVMGSYDADPAAPGIVSRYRNLLHHHVHQTGRADASTFWAGCGAVRRDAFEAVGGFDEDYPVPSVEDIELGARLVRSGYTIRLVKDLQVKHLKRWRLGNMFSTDLWRRAVPWTRLMLREGRLLNDLNLKTRDRVAVAAAGLSLLALALAWRWPALLAMVPLALGVCVILARDLFAFFVRQRGWLFALATVPLYWLYLVTCGLGFSIGLALHLTDRTS